MSPNHKSNHAMQTNTRIWSLVYPIFLYFAVCQIVNLLLELFPSAASVDAVKRQGMGSLAGFFVLYVCFARKEAMQSSLKKKLFVSSVSGRTVVGMLAAVLLLGCAGVAMNNLIILTNLKQVSESYQTVEQAFYSSSLGWEILALGIVTPFAEELLYRYIIFYHLRDWMGRMTAIVGSALLFGLIHMNIVQAVYAFVLGLLLGILMEAYQDVRVAVCGHVAANIISLLRGETHVLEWLQPGNTSFLPVTIGMLALVLGSAGLLVKTFKKE